MKGLHEMTLQNQMEHVYQQTNHCNTTYGAHTLEQSNEPFYSETQETWMCPAIFDGITCWPPTTANTTAITSCTEHVIGFLKHKYAEKFCTENGTWYTVIQNETTSSIWTNYSQCYSSENVTIEIPAVEINISTIQKYVPIIKTISRTGYSISFITLVVAFIIMFCIKKLHCPRNKLHMHLFASFILRALTSLIKDISFIAGLGLPWNLIREENDNYSLIDGINADCKLITSLWEYFITANYSWILMEGLYLHNLIFRAMFADSNRKITHYIVLGWGLPMLVIIPWIVTRVLMEDTLCWTKHDTQLFLIIRIPTVISVLVNLILFVRIAAVIFSKLRNPLYEEAKRYRKWARSTLVLAPLFGIHYALFMGMSFNKNEVVELVWLFIDQTFASTQGFFVAILYCFLNSEVRSELKPHIYTFLTRCANSDCLKYCFPCREAYLKSAGRCRTSVCTTMSCSSLYNNGFHRNSRNYPSRTKHGNIYMQGDEHACRPNCKKILDINQKRISNLTNASGGCSKSSLAFSSLGSTINEKCTFIDETIQEKCECESKFTKETIPLNTIGT